METRERSTAPVLVAIDVLDDRGVGDGIGRTPITNATYLTFVGGGGYERREWWSDEGWSWKEDYDITRPQSWTADHRSKVAPLGTRATAP